MNLKPESKNKPQEHRVKVALKEKPKTKKTPAVVKKIKKPPQKIPSMPKGKQLEKIPTQTKKQNKVKKRESSPKEREKVTKPIQKSKPPVKVDKPVYASTKKSIKKDVNLSKKPKKKSGLYAMLSKKQKNPINKVQPKTQSGSQIGRDFQEAYGETFGKLSEGEKKYMIDNQEVMRRITQEQLNRLAPVNIPRNLSVTTSNIIEFNLHPNGDISDLRLITASGTEILDDTSLQTIEYSYHRYPLPKQKTRVRYKVGYYLSGRRGY